MDSEPETIKVIVVGDGSVGKTCILLSYTTDRFPDEYTPTVFDNYTAQVLAQGKSINLSLWDTAGQESYSQLRQLCYNSGDVFCIVFAVTDESSFENALNKWYPELNSGELQKVPKIIIGNKIDMRDDTNNKHICEESAKLLVQKLNCTYLECSALTQVGLKNVFDEAIRLSLINRNQKIIVPKKTQKTCIIF